MIEKLTDAERELLTQRGGGTCARAVRIIDQQAQALERFKLTVVSLTQDLERERAGQR